MGKSKKAGGMTGQSTRGGRAGEEIRRVISSSDVVLLKLQIKVNCY